MRIVMGTEGPCIPAGAIGDRPLGGAETAFALLAEAFERRGHAVEAPPAAQISTACPRRSNASASSAKAVSAPPSGRSPIASAAA